MLSLQPSSCFRVALRPDLSSSDLALIRAAIAVLDLNGASMTTSASVQTSWDAGFRTMGYAHYDQALAMQELRLLFEGQWRNGLLPHLVFHHRRPGPSGIPGPLVWQAERSPFAPPLPTSGIVQPPLHATAAWHLYCHATDRAAARAFLVELFPQLIAWHHYLYRERDIDQNGLVYIRHPWESGQENSPLWDGAMQRICVTPDHMQRYQPADLSYLHHRHPSESDHNKGIYLVTQARRHDYDEATIRAEAPFLVQDVLFNALLVRANRDLAAIARLLKFDPTPFERWAEQTAIAMNEVLWCPEAGQYQSYDLVGHNPIAATVAANFAPLYGQVPSPFQAYQLVQQLATPAFRAAVVGTCGVPTCSREAQTFDGHQPWRGAIWLNLNWMLYQGLTCYGYSTEATQLRQASLILAKQGGLYESFHPDTGKGVGTNNSAGAAALMLNLLLDA
ncbi:MAG: trehalase family glycosidase [Cyanobacteria bacterium P01_A01_bin.135]